MKEKYPDEPGLFFKLIICDNIGIINSSLPVNWNTASWGYLYVKNTRTLTVDLISGVFTQEVSSEMGISERQQGMLAVILYISMTVVSLTLPSVFKRWANSTVITITRLHAT